MSAEHTAEKDAGLSTPAAPTPQGLVLFEQYEASGALLVVTSDASSLRLEPGDAIYRRAWATASEPVEVNRARVTPGGSDA